MMLNLLEKVASALIRKYKPVVICITGSVGKTSTKDAVASCLTTSFKVRKTPKNLNNEYGVPISVIGGFKFKEGFFAISEIIINGLGQLLIGTKFPEVLVIEVGAGKIGEIERVSKWLRADILIITNLPDKPSHLGVFGTMEKIIKEKKFLANVMGPQGKLFVDVSEKNINIFTDGFKGEIIYYDSKKIAESSDYSILYRKQDSYNIPVGIKLSFDIYDKRKIEVELYKFLGVQNIKALNIARLIAQELHCQPEKIVSGLQNYTPEAGRLRILPGKNENVTIIDDSFNSSLIAVENSLRNFLSIDKYVTQRRIAVLGDMLNLGPESEDIHKTESLRGYISQVDIIVTVGSMSEVWQSYNSNKFNLNRHFLNSTNAAKYIQSILQSGDLVLFKGGHLTRLEKAVKMLAVCKNNDLVRQEDYWQKTEFELYDEKEDNTQHE